MSEEAKGTPGERLARHLENRMRGLGLITYRYKFLAAGPPVAVPIEKEAPRPTTVPAWATPGALVNLRNVRAEPYRVVATGPILCLLENDRGDENPIDTSLLVAHWGPGPR